jgi:hypothetical protein
MEFVLTFHQPAEVFEINDDPVRGATPTQAWKTYTEGTAAVGVLREAKRLEHDQPTAVRVRNGKRQVQDGPFVDTKDLLGGFAVVDVDSLDEALKWAERCPGSAAGSTLVWPVRPMPPR